LVEDDNAIVMAIKHGLTDSRIDLIIARDGESGLVQAKEAKPDLILLDIIMPKMDGMTMLKKVRASAWGKKIPVIILTNLSSPVHEMTASKLDVYEYLVKTDWRLQDVVKKVNQALDL